MVDGHFETAKSLYLGIGSTDHYGIWLIDILTS